MNPKKLTNERLKTEGDRLTSAVFPRTGVSQPRESTTAICVWPTKHRDPGWTSVCTRGLDPRHGVGLVEPPRISAGLVAKSGTPVRSAPCCIEASRLGAEKTAATGTTWIWMCGLVGAVVVDSGMESTIRIW